MSHILGGDTDVSKEPGPTASPSNHDQLIQLPTELLIDVIAVLNTAHLEDSDRESDPLVAL
jgi:hypothetical protein